jgi:hypothetical protein
MRHARRFYVTVLLLLALNLVASQAFAFKNQYGPGPQTKRFSAKGVVVEVNSTDSTMTLKVDRTSRLLRDQLGLDFDFEVSEKVKVKTEGMEPGVFDLTLKDVEAGDTVRVLGKFDGTTYLVTHIVVFIDG